MEWKGRAGRAGQGRAGQGRACVGSAQQNTQPAVGGINLPLVPAPPATAACLQKYVFYAAMSPLVAFYILFTVVLYPMHGSLHLNGFYAATAPLVPHGLHGLLKGGCRWRGGEGRRLGTWERGRLQLCAPEHGGVCCHQPWFRMPAIATTHPPTRPLAPPPACLCHVLPPPCSD